MNPWDYVAALKHRWKLVLLILLMTVLAVSVWTLMSKRIYESSFSLLFKGFEPTDANPRDQTANDALALGTPADVIASDLVAHEVVRNLKLAERPGTIERWRAATGGRGTVETWLAKNLSAGLIFTPSTKSSNVLRVAFRSSDPDEAAAIANGFADQFLRTQLMLRVQPARIYSGWFQHRMSEVRARLEAAQARLTEFQRTHGLIGGDHADVEMNRLTELSSELASAEAADAEAGSHATTDVANSPEVQSSAVVQGLRTAIATEVAKLDQLRTTYGQNYPDVVASKAHLSALRSELAQAVGTAARAVKVAGNAAQGREVELRRRLEEQRSHVLALSSSQDQLAILQRDVNTAQLEYDGVTQRLNAMRLQSELPQADAYLLDRATPSFLPVSPNVPLRAILAVIIGMGLGISLVIFLEWRTPRFRTDQGLQQITGLPVFVSLERRGGARPQIAFQR
jgi:uncharacterized protein involved in exopolysaccharide biosynthesis